MIVCHCNIVTSRDIEEAVRGLLESDPWIHLTPGSVLHALEKRGKCCGCFPALVEVMISVVEKIRASDDEIHPEWADTTLTRLRLLNERRHERQRVEARNRSREHRARQLRPTDADCG